MVFYVVMEPTHIFLISILIALGTITLLIFIKEYRLLIYACIGNLILQSAVVFGALFSFNRFGAHVDYLELFMNTSEYVIVLFAVGLVFLIALQLVGQTETWKYSLLLLSFLSVQLLLWGFLLMLTESSGQPETLKSLISVATP
jgi:hypothetical protein